MTGIRSLLVYAFVSLLSVTARAAIVNIGTNSGKAATNLTITVPAGGVPAHALIVVCVAAAASAAGTAIDSASNTYHQTTGGGAGQQAQILYSFNSAALVSGNTITVQFTSLTYAISGFYWDGADTAADPLEFGTENSGNSTAPSGTVGGTPTRANSLVVGCLATNGPSGDTFTQDSTNGAYATPPNRTGTSGGSTASNRTVAGGTLIASTNKTYAPTITTNPWVLIVTDFKPPAAGVTNHPGVRFLPAFPFGS